MFLLDTMAVSEFEGPEVNPGLAEWFSTVDWDDLYISVITVAELQSGILHLPNGAKRQRLEAWFDLLCDRFETRILPVSKDIAQRYADVQVRRGPLPIFDTLIGATALVNRLTVVTRNIADVGRTGARIVDPWT